MISIKTDLEFGSSWYILNDPEQNEYHLIGVVVMPGKQLKFKLKYMEDEQEVFDFECSQERDILKAQKYEDDED